MLRKIKSKNNGERDDDIQSRTKSLVDPCLHHLFRSNKVYEEKNKIIVYLAYQSFGVHALNQRFSLFHIQSTCITYELAIKYKITTFLVYFY